MSENIFLVKILEILIPIGVATITAYSAIAVAKINKIQKSIVTNHGTSGIGEAVDIIRSRVDIISENQKDIYFVVNHLQEQEKRLDTRVSKLEHYKEKKK